MQPTIFSLERLAEFQQLEIERDARELWKWRVLDRIKPKDEELTIMTIRLAPYVKMNGNAKEAIRFYEKALDAKVVKIQTYGELPMPFPVELKDLVAHSIVKVGETNLMFSDTPGQSIQTGDNLTLCISTNSVYPDHLYMTRKTH